VHITAHQQRSLSGGGQTLHSLEIAVRGGGDGFVHASANLIGKFSTPTTSATSTIPLLMAM